MVAAILIGLAAVLIVASFFFPYWTMTLYAPQYPKGLTATVFLNRVEGDVWEISILNHYIGMAPLDEAAQVERRLSGYGVAALTLLTLAVLVVPERLARWLAIPVAAFPFVFLGVLWRWLYRFGHDLDPRAPIRLDPFTPVMLGTGHVAQFRTEAMVSTGFFMALAAAVLVLAALYLGARRRGEGGAPR